MAFDLFFEYSHRRTNFINLESYPDCSSCHWTKNRRFVVKEFSANILTSSKKLVNVMFLYLVCSWRTFTIS